MMTISDSVLQQAREIVARPGFRDEPRHQIGNTAFFVASASEHAEGYPQKGNVTVELCDYPIIFIPRTW